MNKFDFDNLVSIPDCTLHFTPVYDWMWEADMTSSEMLVYTMLFKFYRKELNVERIASLRRLENALKGKVSLGTIKKCLGTLQNKGFIIKQKRHDKQNGNNLANGWKLKVPSVKIT